MKLTVDPDRPGGQQATTTIPVFTIGRHKRTHAGTRVPTNRSHAHCECGLHVTLPCPLHLAALYALNGAQHRSDRPTELNTRPPIEQLTRLDHVHINGQCIKDRHGTCHLKDGSDG